MKANKLNSHQVHYYDGLVLTAVNHSIYLFYAYLVNKDGLKVNLQAISLCISESGKAATHLMILYSPQEHNKLFFFKYLLIDFGILGVTCLHKIVIFSKQK